MTEVPRIAAVRASTSRCTQQPLRGSQRECAWQTHRQPSLQSRTLIVEGRIGLRPVVCETLPNIWASQQQSFACDHGRPGHTGHGLYTTQCNPFFHIEGLVLAAGLALIGGSKEHRHMAQFCIDAQVCTDRALCNRHRNASNTPDLEQIVNANQI